jgi:hypothetical protein
MREVVAYFIFPITASSIPPIVAYFILPIMASRRHVTALVYRFNIQIRFLIKTKAMILSAHISLALVSRNVKHLAAETQT